MTIVGSGNRIWESLFRFSLTWLFTMIGLYILHAYAHRAASSSCILSSIEDSYSTSKAMDRYRKAGNKRQKR